VVLATIYGAPPATEAVKTFDLDLRRAFTVSSVTVNGSTAGFAQPPTSRRSSS
jgi:hypothetical protein